ncbi:MAG: sugar transferase [Lachnospiraceae bacterium]
MYRTDSEEWLKHIDFIILDMICLQLAYILAFAISGYGFNPYATIIYRNMAVFLELADLVVIFAYGTMKSVLKRGYYQDFAVTLKHSIMVGALAIIYLFLIQQGQYFSRMALVLTVVIYLIFTYLAREFWKKFLRKKMKDGGERKLLIITTEAVAEQVVANMQQNNYARYTLAGAAVIDADWTGKRINGVPVVANEETAPMYVCQEWIDEVLIVIPEALPYPSELIEKLTETGVTIHLNLAKITNIPGKKQFVEKVGNYTVLTTSINYASSKQLLLKRLMDIAGGLVGCILTGIICIFVGPAIYLASPGPIFFAQERVGKNGKKFKMYKFRSMYMDAEERKAELMKDNKLGDGKMFKLDFDPRVIGNKILPDGTHKTGIGDFIRRTSLDEFPQFFNVLKGDMSIIGVRDIIGTTRENSSIYAACVA